MQPRFDGLQLLTDLLTRDPKYGSVEKAVAAHTVFLHPRTVEQTDGRALFPIVRKRREETLGVITEVDGRRVLVDDNSAPRDGFLWTAGMSATNTHYREMQFNHVWPTTGRAPGAYTALWNICATPAFLAKTTDGAYPAVRAALIYRAYNLFGVVPAGQAVPQEPQGYGDLRWLEPLEAVHDLQATLRARLRRNASSSAGRASRMIGWLFSDGEPDATLSA